MTSAIGGIGGGQSVNTTPSSRAPSTTTTQTTQPASADTKPIVQSQVQAVSPRVIVDPVVGLIDQYLDGNGKVTNQFPSAVVVAYLKSGLTQDGFAQPVGKPDGNAFAEA